ncbi:MAG: hypothetical protein WDA12_04345 [Bacilli bacterium]
MSLNKNIQFFLLVIIILLFIMLFIIIQKYGKGDKPLLDNELEIYTPLEKYSLSMSSIKGFPFEINCNNENVIIKISSGVLLDDNDVLLNHNSNFEYEISCNKKIYWNPINNDDYDNKVIDINIRLSNKNSEQKNFKLKKNEENEYYLLD